jgi:hypothetical protein
MEYKGYEIVGDGTFGYKRIKTIGAGQLPSAFKGIFTTPVDAQRSIDAYVLSKEKKNGNPKGKSGG